jgi:uncharacterized protein YjeT (DUF2065 family)
MIGQAASLSDRSLRAGGLALIIVGAVMFHLVS